VISFLSVFFISRKHQIEPPRFKVATSWEQDGSASWTEQAIGVQLHGIGMDLM
jgi:hypothetical protein